MADIVRTGIALVLANHPLVFFVLGLLAALVSLRRSPAPIGAALTVESEVAPVFRSS